MLGMSRAAYFRDYRKKRPERDRVKAYLAGFHAAKRQLTHIFSGIGKGEMNGNTGVEIVRNAQPDVSQVPRGT